MKIGVISDIHMKSDDGTIQKIIDRYLNDVDMFFLCGDLTSMDVLDIFSDRAVHAVSGNMDDYMVQYNLPIKKVINLEGHKIGLIHGFGAPNGIKERIRKEFVNVDCIVFGHTHAAENQVIDGTMFFNPGSPTDKRFAAYNSIGILDISKNGIKGEIIKI